MHLYFDVSNAAACANISIMGSWVCSCSRRKIMSIRSTFAIRAILDDFEIQPYSFLMMLAMDISTFWIVGLDWIPRSSVALSMISKTLIKSSISISFSGVVTVRVSLLFDGLDLVIFTAGHPFIMSSMRLYRRHITRVELSLFYVSIGRNGWRKSDDFLNAFFKWIKVTKDCLQYLTILGIFPQYVQSQYPTLECTQTT